MHGIAADWRDLAAVLREQSERETCAPALFEEAGARATALATSEEAFFRDLEKAAA